MLPHSLTTYILKVWLHGRLFSAILGDCGRWQWLQKGQLAVMEGDGDNRRGRLGLMSPTNEKSARWCDSGYFVQYFEEIADNCHWRPLFFVGLMMVVLGRAVIGRYGYFSLADKFNDIALYKCCVYLGPAACQQQFRFTQTCQAEALKTFELNYF